MVGELVDEVVVEGEEGLGRVERLLRGCGCFRDVLEEFRLETSGLVDVVRDAGELVRVVHEE